MAACAGVVVAIIFTQLRYGKADVTMALNGALAGLVAITAEPLTPNVGMAIIIGGIGGALPVIVVPILDKLKIDDVVGAIPVHLVAGIWGTLAVPLTNGDVPFVAQITGVIATGIFVSVISAIVWFILKATIGLRPTEAEELAGLDHSETGIEAYPEFVTT
jgi:ammonium transporter, Amt family